MLILTVLQGPDKGARFELPDDEPQMIGRSSESLPLTDYTISRRHCELTPDEGVWYIRDLDSANGTFLNGTRVADRHRLEPGDQIRAGNSLIVFGRDTRTYKDFGLKVAKPGEMSVNVEKTVPSAEDSMVLAVADPSQAAVTQLKVIYELTQLVGTVINREDLLERIMDVIFEHFQPDRAFMLLLKNSGRKRGAPEPVVVRHKIKPKDKHAGTIPVSQTIVQHAIRNREGVLSSNAMTDTRFKAGDSVREFGIRSALCAPIMYKDEVFGVIHLDSKIANFTFTEDQLRLLTAIGVQTGLAIANVQLYADHLRAERLAAVGQTVASLSHSIRNILQGLRGGADVVELGMRKGKMEVIRNGWAIVSRNLERIMALTRNMLAYSKDQKPDLGIHNVQPQIEEVLALVHRQFDDKKVALVTDLDADMPPFPLDAEGLHQALLNLLNNALDAVAPNVGVVTVRAGYDEAAHRARIEVIDNGVGIADEDRDHLFEPFYSTKGLKGTGLGLVVTKKIVEAHGGQLLVVSKPGEGTHFTVLLPTTAGREPGQTAVAERADTPAEPDLSMDEATGI